MGIPGAGEVGEQRIEVGLGPRDVRAVCALLELGKLETTRGEVVAEFLNSGVPFGEADPQGPVSGHVGHGRLRKASGCHVVASSIAE
jgi:hypothetical protein